MVGRAHRSWRGLCTFGREPEAVGAGGVFDPDRDGAEWSVFLRRNGLNDVAQGDRLKVKGVLRVIEHPPATVNGQVVPSWTEARVAEG